jgi:glucose-6-phosphate isomerase
MSKQLETTPFHQCKAYRKLAELAREPYDLTAPDAVTAERLEAMRASSCGWTLTYGLERVDEQVMEVLHQLAAERHLLDKMKSMQAGEVTNYITGFPSENRTVLHTATRDLFESPQKGAEAAEASRLARVELDKLTAFINRVEQRFTDLVFIGIGGSELGPKMLYEGLQGYLKEGRSVRFVSNVDPDETAQKLKGLDLKRTLIAVVSKSGGTLETATNERLVRHHFEAAGVDPDTCSIVITCPDSPMDDPSRFLERFYMWDYIGGRYCATSAVGCVVLAFAFGMEVVWEFLRGAHEMDRTALSSDLHENLPLLAALIEIWNRNFLSYPTIAIIPYSQMLWRFAAHIQQLDMESNGKRIDKQGRPVEWHTGPVVWGEPSTNAQHSFFQLIHQGTDPIPIEFIGFRECQWGHDLEFQGTNSQQKLLANLFAQGLALAMGQQSDNPNKTFPGNRPSLMMLADRLTPHALGSLLAFYEHKVAFQGFAWGINSFDQEGVQLGKVLAKQILGRMEAVLSGKPGNPYPLGDFYLKMMGLE